MASVRRTQIVIALAYLYDSLVLAGFWAAGFVDASLPIVVFTLFAASTAAVYWAHASRWSMGRKDPTLFLPQQIYAVVVVLGVTIAAPQIGFQPLATLFAISAFSFMAPNQNSLILCWIAAAIGAVVAIFIAGPRLAMPTSTLAGQALTSAVVVGLLSRCMWIAISFRSLQQRVRLKNRALGDALARIDALAHLDDLTGLPNRRAITDWLSTQMAFCRRTETPLSVAFIDLDHFKTINDRFGHLAGDRTLQIFADAALGVIRASDRLGRYGGEEFLLVMMGTTSDDAQGPLERIRARVSTLDWAAIDARMSLTITIGAAECTREESAETLIKRADLALYLGKAAGRDRVIIDPIPFERAARVAAGRAR